MKFLFFSKSTCDSGGASPWPWPPTCVIAPKTLSFRANDRLYTTVNSAYLHDGDGDGLPSDFDESAVIGGLRSDRLLFRPGESSSILEEAKPTGTVFKDPRDDTVSVPRITPSNCKHPSNDAVFVPEATDSTHSPNDVVLVAHSPDDAVSLSEATDNETSPDDAVSVVAMDSDDPYGDFRTSMAEMVTAHELKDWESLEELLEWYLRVNHSDNHGFIIAAFADLVMYLSGCRSPPIDEHCSSSSTQNFSFTSPLSFSSSSTSPRPSSPENDDSVNKEH